MSNAKLTGKFLEPLTITRQFDSPEMLGVHIQGLNANGSPVGYQTVQRDMSNDARIFVHITLGYMSPDQADELATILMYYAKRVREGA